ncbi:hypothetical protein A3C23_01425 [Candidatus Roizmanbacteria bacterium RIFCSPHIGHO2_02_FULL_37_13b]|uniref:RNA polymerase sigma factor n=1 Tax=Candidatus Roizmanbacteria bacterium RIFCSPLOWO2_02_FULL_36_11 TaxID=1802071 RepID=A0A1F7JIG8_9BACT|nr:MAG: hypothetical protein A3C23_01425 [Candidatus Roizmanbacteria bacterium RIFCSPHIGHO2_02_FULL_37_13b]OGK55398.1 MAG: hypothetical protein A3H78_05895 [Candidatus Roizmanbacteria bacterium RIFCSPLOWO2_02_FULL_36_11]
MKRNKEDELYSRIIRRDDVALYNFYKEHRQTLYHFILRQIKEKADAEEILQDAFLGFIESLRDFRGQSSMKTFLFSIAKNKIIDKLRRRKIKKILFSSLPKGFVESLSTILLDDEIDRRYITNKIDSIFNKLPNDYATVLRLKYKEGYKVQEIAQKVKLSFKATESLIFRARKAFVIAYNQHEEQGISPNKTQTARSLLTNPQ